MSARPRYLSLLFDVLFLPGFRQWQARPETVSDVSDVHTYATWAQRAEEATFDGIFFADFVGLRRSQLAMGPLRPFDPFTQAAVVSAATRNLGLVVTASTQFNHPYDLTRRLSSLDNAAPGRVGWNVVTSFAGEGNFGLERIPSPEERYARADEFVEVVERLWQSWPDDLKSKQRTGIPASTSFFDSSRIVDIAHRGDHFRVDGALDIPPASPDRPVYFQAGASEPGIAFAARYAEAIFAAIPTLGVAEEYDARLRNALAGVGRTRDAVKVIPGLNIVTASTDAEARELEKLPPPDAQLIAAFDGIKEEVPLLRGAAFGLDDTLPDGWFPTAAQIATLPGRRSRADLYRRIAEQPNLTLRDFLQRATRGGAHARLAGSPRSIVATIERWFASGYIDGFVLISTNDIDVLLDEIIPELKNRGLVKPDYLGATFRENLGLG